MKVTRVFLVALCICVGFGCSEQTKSTSHSESQPVVQSANPADYAEVVIDKEHQIQGSNPAPAYEIPPSAGIRIDGRHFAFADGQNKVIPNMVQVVVGQSQLLKLSQRIETNYFILDGTTITSVQGGAYRGFKSGDKLTLAVGHTISGNPAEEAISVLWTATVLVK